MTSFSLHDGMVVAGRYRLGKPLGHGAYGVVYEAEQMSDGSRVAVKVMHERHMDTTDAVRFERESGLVMRLKNPHVVQVVDFGHDGELPYIAFELLSGRTLATEIEERGALGIERCVHIARQVLVALEAAHASSIVHRDVKPANIFLCDGYPQRDFAKVLDFGTAKALSDVGAALTSTGQMLGTVQYMAPEQVRGIDVDETADLYSLGAVMAEMITGQKLIRGMRELDVFLAHVSEEPVKLPRVVGEGPLGPVIARAMSKRPPERYRSARAMREALDAAMPEARIESLEEVSRSQERAVGTPPLMVIADPPSGIVAREQARPPTSAGAPSPANAPSSGGPASPGTEREGASARAEAQHPPPQGAPRRAPPPSAVGALLWQPPPRRTWKERPLAIAVTTLITLAVCAFVAWLLVLG
jgi:serine/threonine-protein kinase